jgi:hypothetical protein
MGVKWNNNLEKLELKWKTNGIFQILLYLCHIERCWSRAWLKRLYMNPQLRGMLYYPLLGICYFK